MKNHLFAALAAAMLTTACMNTPTPIAQGNNAAKPAPTTERPQTAIAHTTENQAQPAPYANPSSPKSGGATGDPIDTKAFDSAIMAAEKGLAAKPDDTEAKRSLANAFFKRAMALTEARQYASALGDYRRTLKYDPANAEAKNWIEQITMIYGSLNKPAPAEGQEPPPLPFEGKKS